MWEDYKVTSYFIPAGKSWGRSEAWDSEGKMASRDKYFKTKKKIIIIIIIIQRGKIFILIIISCHY